MMKYILVIILSLPILATEIYAFPSITAHPTAVLRREDVIIGAAWWQRVMRAPKPKIPYHVPLPSEVPTVNPHFTLPRDFADRLLLNLEAKAVFENLKSSDIENAMKGIGVDAQRLRSHEIPVSPPPVDGFAVVPTDNDTYQQTFGADPSGKQLQASVDVESKFRKNSVTTDFDEIPMDINEFASSLKRSTSSLYVITGHNVGGKFIVPPGGAILLKDMATKCETVKKICVFLSCNSSLYVPSLGVKRSLSLEDANDILTKIQKLGEYAIVHKETETRLISAISIMIKQKEREQNVKYNFSRIAPYATVGGVGIIVIELKDK